MLDNQLQETLKLTNDVHEVYKKEINTKLEINIYSMFLNFHTLYIVVLS